VIEEGASQPGGRLGSAWDEGEDEEKAQRPSSSREKDHAWVIVQKTVFASPGPEREKE